MLVEVIYKVIIDDTAFITGVDLLWVATHEVGHALGLHHDTQRGTVMYAKYPGFQRNLKLHSNDIYYIRQLYG